MTNESTPDATADTPTQPSDATAVERNKAVSRRWIEVFNERDDAGEADVRTQDYVAYAPVSLESAAGFAGAFLANSIGVVPVSRIGEHDYQPDNATFTRIRGTYHEVAWDEI